MPKSFSEWEIQHFIHFSDAESKLNENSQHGWEVYATFHHQRELTVIWFRLLEEEDEGG